MYTSGAKACGYIIPQEKRRNLGAPTQVDCCAEEVHSACFVWDEKYFPSSPPSLPQAHGHPSMLPIPTVTPA